MNEFDVVERMRRAMNARDLDALAQCFAEDYRCDIPLHPSRSFVGREQVRANWGGLFTRVPDLVTQVLRSTRDGDVVWSEWEMSGPTAAGSRFHVGGVAILNLDHDVVESARFYLDPIDGATAPQNPVK